MKLHPPCNRKQLEVTVLCLVFRQGFAFSTNLVKRWLRDLFSDGAQFRPPQGRLHSRSLWARAMAFSHDGTLLAFGVNRRAGQAVGPFQLVQDPRIHTSCETGGWLLSIIESQPFCRGAILTGRQEAGLPTIV